MKAFQLACYHALMDHHGRGIEEAHPSYMLEKAWMLEPQNHADCFAALDKSNQRRVVAWCKKWGVEIPLEVVKYLEELKKMREKNEI